MKTRFVVFRSLSLKARTERFKKMDCSIELKEWNESFQVSTFKILIRNFKDDFVFYKSPIGGLNHQILTEKANALIRILEKTHDHM